MDRIFIDDCRHWLTETDYPAEGGYDLVYIDPPYDTGTKFSYNDRRDDWVEWMATLMAATHGHLRDDGIMFVSIDDNRIVELCVICDEVFGKANRLAIMVTHQAQRSNAKHINVVHEYVVAYAKDKRKLPALSVPRMQTQDASLIRSLERDVRREMQANGRDSAQRLLRRRIAQCRKDGIDWLVNYRCVDDEGRIFYPQDLSVPGPPNSITLPEIGLRLEPLRTRRWSTPEKFLALHAEGRLEFLNGRPYEKHYLTDARDPLSSLLPFYSRQGTEELKRLGCGGLFDTPKPPAMIEMFVLAVAGSRKEMRVLDFFGGSGTTAQACWQAQDKMGEACSISFDLVQVDEAMREGTTPYRKAMELGLEPRMSSAIRHRVDMYLAQSDAGHSYEMIRVQPEGGTPPEA